jgi:hypothetical protein
MLICNGFKVGQVYDLPYWSNRIKVQTRSAGLQPALD